MIIVSIDIETTGLNPEKHQILSIGIIIEDTEKKLSFEKIPKLHLAIVHKELRGGLFALNMNADLINLINKYDISDEKGKNDLSIEHDMIFTTEEEACYQILSFLGENGFDTVSIKFTAAGKNFATFDKLFLEKLPRWKQYFQVKQRVLDPTPYFIDWNEDEELPNLSKCKERAGFPNTVTHNAIEDAWDIVELLRKQY